MPMVLASDSDALCARSSSTRSSRFSCSSAPVNTTSGVHRSMSSRGVPTRKSSAPAPAKVGRSTTTTMDSLESSPRPRRRLNKFTESPKAAGTPACATVPSPWWRPCQPGNGLRNTRMIDPSDDLEPLARWRIPAFPPAKDPGRRGTGARASQLRVDWARGSFSPSQTSPLSPGPEPWEMTPMHLNGNDGWRESGGFPENWTHVVSGPYISGKHCRLTWEYSKTRSRYSGSCPDVPQI